MHGYMRRNILDLSLHQVGETKQQTENHSIYKERAAPPIGGTALHDSGVKTVQWRKREGHDSYQEVEVYIYKYIYRQIFVKKLWH